MFEKLIRLAKSEKESPMYLVGGTIVTALQYISVFILTQFANLWHIVSYAISLVLGILALFFFHKHVTFKHLEVRHITKGASIFFALALSAVAGTIVGVYILSDILGVNYMFAGIISGTLCAIPVYFLNKQLVFKRSFIRLKKKSEIIKHTPRRRIEVQDRY